MNIGGGTLYLYITCLFVYFTLNNTSLVDVCRDGHISFHTFVPLLRCIMSAQTNRTEKKPTTSKIKYKRKNKTTLDTVLPWSFCHSFTFFFLLLSHLFSGYKETYKYTKQKKKRNQQQQSFIHNFSSVSRFLISLLIFFPRLLVFSDTFGLLIRWRNVMEQKERRQKHKSCRFFYYARRENACNGAKTKKCAK